MNDLEKQGLLLMRSGRFRDALKVWYYMAEGDPSLDGGSLGEAIGECYEALGDLSAARYWFSRAVEENPAIEDYQRSFERLKAIVGAPDLK